MKLLASLLALGFGIILVIGCTEPRATSTATPIEAAETETSATATPVEQTVSSLPATQTATATTLAATPRPTVTEVATNTVPVTVTAAATATVLPTATQSPPATAVAPVVYTVVAGDTLSAIASVYGTTVARLQAANGIPGDIIYIGQELIIPPTGADGTASGTEPPGDAAPQSAPTFSILTGDLASAYPLTAQGINFTVRYPAEAPFATEPQTMVVLVEEALAHLETMLQTRLIGTFDAYVAVQLFAPPNQALHGRSFSADRRFFFLYDALHPADLRYLVTHELTHLFAWNTFGVPSSVMLSEGLAVYTGMTQIAGSEHMPPAQFCAAYAAADALPRIATQLPYRGHIRDLANYYAAGCFVEFLIQRHGIEPFARLYPTSNYVGIYGKSLFDLEAEWRAAIAANPVAPPVAPGDLVTAVGQVAQGYDVLFANFQGTPDQLAAYQELETVRIALLQGRLDVVEAFFQAP